MNHSLLVSSLCISFVWSVASGQISPGELSRAHEHMEGMTNCTQCHEHGKEITGLKCIGCHLEIQNAIISKHGFHFFNTSSSCITCHKEHLGRDAAITQFDKKKFDHTKTGYTLTGKHASQQCETCHSINHIKDTVITRILKQYPHQSYLGLRQQCSDCHTDPHANSLGSACQNCHTANGWKPASSFSHANTKYPLIGKHGSILCVQCHESFKTRDIAHPLLFSIKEYADCNACHKSPHGERFSKQTCSSCHSPVAWSTVTGFDHSKTVFALIGKHVSVACEKCHTGLTNRDKNVQKDFTTKGFKDCSPCHVSPHAAAFSLKPCTWCHTPRQWSEVSEKNFDHAITSFPLRGKHASLKCNKCHQANGKQSFTNTFKLAKKTCIDCHEDKHKGQFKQKYGNDCSRCHTEEAYSPSTFSFEQHQLTKFVLTNAHLTVPCRECHFKEQDWIFHFEKTSCESCHKDPHNGRFAEFIKEQSCAACHGTDSWKHIVFDHSKTAFRLVGQHATVTCNKCHAKEFKGTSRECNECHTDPHAGQFIDKGKTDCSRCHTPIGRRALVFRHDVQSTFALTGLHVKVECGACHKPEMKNGKLIVRYKPLSSKCESCHQGKI